MKQQAQDRIILLFNANRVYDRQILKGIGDFLQAKNVDWNIYISDDLPEDVHDNIQLTCDGIIANYDNMLIKSILNKITCPIVGVGASFHNENDYPPISYVASDNYALIEKAFHHLYLKGIKQFAFYSYPCSRKFSWALEREKAFTNILKNHQYDGCVYHGFETTLSDWQENLEQLAAWLDELPMNTGIIAVNDARARHILQACQMIGKKIPEELCLIGIDNEEVVNYLSKHFLSTVTQGTELMGYKAAQLLHNKLIKGHSKIERLLIPAREVIERRSTDYRSISDPYVIQAMHYIRNYACSGIKVEQVLSYMKLSRSNLEIRFKKELNKTIYTIIHEEKLNKAKYMLVHTELPYSEISSRCGYTSIQYLYFLFKKEFNMTPKEYREKNRFPWLEV